MKDFQKFFYVVHSPNKSLLAAKTPSANATCSCDQLAELVIGAGLAKWLMKKTNEHPNYRLKVTLCPQRAKAKRKRDAYYVDHVIEAL